MIAPRLRTSAGALLPLDVSRWLSPAAPEDDEVLARAQPAVLDVGCGPGRHVLALVRRGRVAGSWPSWTSRAPGSNSFACESRPVRIGATGSPGPGWERTRWARSRTPPA